MQMKHYTCDSFLSNYLPLPRDALTLALPTTALILYALLLDRATLSKKHGYQDSLGWVYCVFPQEELCRTLSISPTSVKHNVKLLESAGLLRRVRRSRKEANRYYMLVPENSLTDTRRAGIPADQGRNSGFHTDRKPAPNNLNKPLNISNAYQCGEEESL